MPVRREDAAYLRIATDITELIQAGKFAVGSFLPTEAELQLQYGVSRHTVREAMKTLHAEGYIQRTSGLGTIVTANHESRRIEDWSTVRDVLAHKRDSRQKITGVDEVDEIESWYYATADAWKHLQWIRVSMLRFPKNQSVPFAISHLYIDKRFSGVVRKKFVVGSESIYRTPIYEWIEKHYQVHARKVEQSISAVSASSDLASQLGAAEGSPLLRVVRTLVDEQSRPIEIAINHFVGEGFAIKSTFELH
jgi:GntR family transcriptional regulator